jgi:hypothetical protein
MIVTGNHHIPAGLDENRWVSLKTLRVLNKGSVAKGYNRNIWVKIVEKALKDAMDKSETCSWRGLKTSVCLVPLMMHEHKGGEPCEPHVRCCISTGGYLDCDPTLDVPMELFTELPIN